MPSAQAYRDAAEHCRAIARRLHDDVDEVRRRTAPAHIAAGPVGDAIEAFLARSVAHLVDGAARLAIVAAECDRRADVCDAHARAVRRHQDLPLAERMRTPAPTPPADWVGR